jgi:glycosyltransferase involved in cell wall biosynthesis
MIDEKALLIFCSIEVGGLPFKMAEILNRHGVRTYYISVHKNACGHDSSRFHYSDIEAPWDLSSLLENYDQSREIVKLLKGIKRKYSIRGCLATGEKAYLLKQAGINYHYWCYGTDLDAFCFMSPWPEDYSFWKKGLHYVGMSREEAVQSCRNIRMESRSSILSAASVMISPYQFQNYQKLRVHKELFHFPHFFKAPEFDTLLENKKKSKEAVCREIGASGYFFSSTRHVWAGAHYTVSDYKGNDIILRALKLYFRLNPSQDSKVVFVRKGVDVPRTAQLADELGIGRRVVWINEMKREAIDPYYQGADICFGQFGTSVLNFSALEPLVQGTPCVSFFLDGSEDNVPFYKEYPAVFNNKDPELIAEHIDRLMSSKELYDYACYQSWNWVKRNCSEEAFSAALSSILAGK